MRCLHVSVSGAAMRLDAYLHSQFPMLATSKLHQYLRENKIKVNEKKQPLSHRLAAGDEIKLFVPENVLATPAGPLFLQAKPLAKPVYEDADVCIAEKPAGLLCVEETEPACTADTFCNRVLLYLYQKGEYHLTDAFTPCLCHRLDTGTAGLLIIAKNAAAETFLKHLIRQRGIVKQYLCVTFGHPPQKAATLKGYLQKDAVRGMARVLQHAAPGAKAIETRYEVLAQSGRLSLLRVELITGRTHQIRTHFASIGCPLLGDSKYGNNAANRAYKMKYQALCAYSLTFSTLEADKVCGALSGRSFTAQKPWYYEQILNGTLA